MAIDLVEMEVVWNDQVCMISLRAINIAYRQSVLLYVCVTATATSTRPIHLLVAK